jgi:predicted dehydrogenase
VVAVASRDVARGEAFAAEHGLGRVHGSYEALLEDPDVEAVYNPLPNSLHLPWSIRALEAGKHVLCEKPLSRRAADVEEAFDAAERAGRLLMEAFMWRYHPQTDALTGLVGDGAIGPLRTVRAAFGFMLPRGRCERSLVGRAGGGALMDVGCYCVSALRLLAGEPSRVAAEMVAGGEDVDARMVGALRFDGPVLGTFDCGMDIAPRSAIEVVGEAGTLVSGDPWHGGAPALQLLRPVRSPRTCPSRRRIHTRSRSRTSRERCGRAASRGWAAPTRSAQARVIEALYAAAEQGRSVALG